MRISAAAIGVVIAVLGLFLFSGYSLFIFLNRQFRAFDSNRAGLLLAGAGIGLLAFGLRLVVAEGHVSWAPYLDQWNAEISNVLVPLSRGKLDASNLVAGNNEHRVVLTRVFSLGAILFNGSWDNRVMVIGNYFLEASAVAWVCLLAWVQLGWAKGSYIGAAALLPMVLVCDWESIMWSNQAQFIFMAAGSVMALSLIHNHSLRSLGNWGALAMATLMIGSMASGFLTALALATTALLTSIARRQPIRTTLGFCSACAAIAAVGWMARAPYPALHVIYSKDSLEWLKAFLAYAAWPLSPNPVGFSCLWLPWMLLLAHTLRRGEAHPFDSFAIGLGAWGLLQSCALAWARAGLSDLVSSRYTEFLGWGFVANAAATVLLLDRLKGTRRMRLAFVALMAAWLGGIGGVEIWRSSVIYRPYFETFRSYTLEHESRLGTFMRTGDDRVIRSVEFPRIPFYSPDQIISTLLDPNVRPMLPAPMLRDLVRDRNPAQLHSVQDGPLSYAAIHAVLNGPWVAVAGFAMLCAACFFCRPSASDGSGAGRAAHTVESVP